VIAIARITLELAHRVAEGHVLDGLVPFLQVFFAIWWAWMNFTWFASAFDNDDACYRLLVMVQMGGVLVLAAGVPDALDHDNYRGITIGYLIMRLGLIALWLRAAAGCHQARATALRYAVGITALEVAWVLRLALAERGTLTDPWALPVFGALVVAELAVPWWAERAPRSASTTWHPHHIAERYGLFTIIVLGESVLASTMAVIHATGSADHLPTLVLIAVTALVIVAAMWWIYFAGPQHGLITDLRTSILWGYGHFLIFLSAAAIAPGIEVALQYATHEISLEATRAALTYTAPAALYVFMVWLLILRRLLGGAVNIVMPAAAALILASAAGPYSLQVTGVLMVGLVLVTAISPQRERVAGREK
jgi:low temperature requirement protein LtrA